LSLHGWWARGGSAEGEGKGLDARTEKLDLQLAIDDGSWLSDQLVEPLFGHRAETLFINVDSMSGAGRRDAQMRRA